MAMIEPELTPLLLQNKSRLGNTAELCQATPGKTPERLYASDTLETLTQQLRLVSLVMTHSWRNLRPQDHQYQSAQYVRLVRSVAADILQRVVFCAPHRNIPAAAKKPGEKTLRV